MLGSIKNKILDNTIVLLLILSTGGLLFVFNRNFVSIIFFVLLFFTIFFLGKKLKKSLFYSSLFTIFSCVFLGVINYNFAIVEQTLNKYLFHLLSVTLVVTTLFHFKNNRSNEKFVNNLYTVLKIIAVHAFINFLLFFIVKNKLSVISSTYHECETFLNLFFYTTEKGMVELFGLEFCRNQGLFWEPGILQAYLNILFFLEAFVYNRNKKLLLAITFLVLTTYSTTGIAILLIQILIFIKEEFKVNKLLAPLLLFVMLPIYIVFSFNIDSKLRGEKQFSFQKRIFDLTQPLFIAVDHPLTGVGLDLFQFQNIRQEYYISSNTLNAINSFFGVDSKIEVTDKGSSNSIMFLLATTGFPTAILLIYMFFKQQIIFKKRKLWMFILTISVMSEPLLLRPFFFLFICSGFIYMFSKFIFIKKYKS